MRLRANWRKLRDPDFIAKMLTAMSMGEAGRNTLMPVPVDRCTAPLTEHVLSLRGKRLHFRSKASCDHHIATHPLPYSREELPTRRAECDGKWRGAHKQGHRCSAPGDCRYRREGVWGGGSLLIPGYQPEYQLAADAKTQAAADYLSMLIAEASVQGSPLVVAAAIAWCANDADSESKWDAAVALSGGADRTAKVKRANDALCAWLAAEVEVRKPWRV